MGELSPYKSSTNYFYPMSLHGKSLIAGLPLAEGTQTFYAISPITNTRLEPAFHQVGINEVDQALQSAESAFKIFGRSTAETRASLLEKIAEEIGALGDDLLERAHLETGLPLARLTGERGRTVGQLRLFAALIREGSWCDARIDPALPDRNPLPRTDLRRMLVPLGPVAVFGSSNFPLAFSVAGGDTASALATGNPVIVKAHRAHPGTSEMVATAIVRAIASLGLPAGIFAMLHGSGAEIGTALVRHPLTRAAGFTGSRLAGRALFDAAASRPDPIPVFAEMSSLNPLFLLPGAIKERSAQLVEGLKNSVTMGVGQFCTKPGLVFGVAGTEFGAFTQSFAEAIRTTLPGTMLTQGICQAFQAGLQTMEAVDGVLKIAASTTEPDPAQTHGQPVICATDAKNFLAQPTLQEEVFGPYALLVNAVDLPQLTQIAEKLEGQLTATVHGTEEDLAQSAELLHALQRRVGRLVVNGFPTGVEVSPAMHHGGPFPATTDERFTSVGTAAILRFTRPVCYQNFPASALPPELLDANPCGIMRTVDGTLTRSAIA